MKTLLICMALYASQMIILQSKQVIHLKPHRVDIDSSFGGKLLELINAPPLLDLPKLPPKQDSEGNPWLLEVKNLGPGVVTVGTMVGMTPQFSISVNVNQTVHIYSSGKAYYRKW